MLRELDMNEMEMVAGGESDEIIVTGQRRRAEFNANDFGSFGGGQVLAGNTGAFGGGGGGGGDLSQISTYVDTSIRETTTQPAADSPCGIALAGQAAAQRGHNGTIDQLAGARNINDQLMAQSDYLASRWILERHNENVYAQCIG